MDHYRKQASRAGLSLSDYLGARLAEAHGLDVAAYVDDHRGQQLLPLGESEQQFAIGA